jgi:hypothetical protein
MMNWLFDYSMSLVKFHILYELIDHFGLNAAAMKEDYKRIRNSLFRHADQETPVLQYCLAYLHSLFENIMNAALMLFLMPSYRQQNRCSICLQSAFRAPQQITTFKIV